MFPLIFSFSVFNSILTLHKFETNITNIFTSLVCLYCRTSFLGPFIIVMKLILFLIAYAAPFHLLVSLLLLIQFFVYYFFVKQKILFFSVPFRLSKSILTDQFNIVFSSYSYFMFHDSRFLRYVLIFVGIQCFGNVSYFLFDRTMKTISPFNLNVNILSGIWLSPFRYFPSPFSIIYLAAYMSQRSQLVNSKG